MTGYWDSWAVLINRGDDWNPFSIDWEQDNLHPQNGKTGVLSVSESVHICSDVGCYPAIFHVNWCEINTITLANNRKYALVSDFYCLTGKSHQSLSVEGEEWRHNSSVSLSPEGSQWKCVVVGSTICKSIVVYVILLDNTNPSFLYSVIQPPLNGCLPIQITSR